MPESLSWRLSRALAWLLVVAVAVQFYTAGLGIFGAAPFTAHAVIGLSAILVSVVLAVLVLVARRRRAIALIALGCLILTMFQPALIHAIRPRSATLAALHPVLGLLIAILAWQVAARRTARVSDDARPGL